MHMATRAPARTRPANPFVWTRAHLERLPDDGNRYEVLDGALFVTPLPTAVHQFVATNLTVRLHAYCVEHGLGIAVGPGAVVFGKNELQPDVVVFPRGPRHRKEKWASLPRPLLAVEVLSDSTSRRDLGLKQEAYIRRRRIPEYWAVDDEERRVHVWKVGTPGETIVTRVLRWQPREDIATLEIDLRDVLPPA